MAEPHPNSLLGGEGELQLVVEYLPFQCRACLPVLPWFKRLLRRELLAMTPRSGLHVHPPGFAILLPAGDNVLSYGCAGILKRVQDDTFSSG
jgi:hypothetical protein